MAAGGEQPGWDGVMYVIKHSAYRNDPNLDDIQDWLSIISYITAMHATLSNPLIASRIQSAHFYLDALHILR